MLAPKSNEPAPQRPEIRLTKEAISGHKQGMKAPLEALEQQQAAAAAQEVAAASSRAKSKPSSSPASAPQGPGGLSQFKAAADKAKGKHRVGDEDEDALTRKKGVGIAAARDERKRRGNNRRVVDAGDEDVSVAVDFQRPWSTAVPTRRLHGKRKRFSSCHVQ